MIWRGPGLPPTILNRAGTCRVCGEAFRKNSPNHEFCPKAACQAAAKREREARAPSRQKKGKPCPR